jgi:hypothetical protein
MAEPAKQARSGGRLVLPGGTPCPHAAPDVTQPPVPTPIAYCDLRQRARQDSNLRPTD